MPTFERAGSDAGAAAAQLHALGMYVSVCVLWGVHISVRRFWSCALLSCGRSDARRACRAAACCALLRMRLPVRARLLLLAVPCVRQGVLLVRTATGSSSCVSDTVVVTGLQTDTVIAFGCMFKTSTTILSARICGVESWLRAALCLPCQFPELGWLY